MEKKGVEKIGVIIELCENRRRENYKNRKKIINIPLKKLVRFFF